MGDALTEAVKGGIRTWVNILLHELKRGEVWQVFVGLNSFGRKNWHPCAVR